MAPFYIWKGKINQNQTYNSLWFFFVILSFISRYKIKDNLSREICFWKKKIAFLHDENVDSHNS